MSLTIDTAALQKVIQECGSPNALAEAASGLQAVGSSIGSAGDRLVSRWRGLGGCYFAPEAGQLVTAIQPVQTRTDAVGSSIPPVGSALSTLAGELTTLKPKLQELLDEAIRFNAYAASHPGWTQNGGQQSSGGKAGGEFPGQPHGVGNQPGQDNVQIQQWHDRIVREIEEYTGKVLVAEARCAHTITTYVDSAAIGGPGVSNAKPAAPPWDVQLLQGRHPFGDLWIDKGPWLSRAGVGLEKSLLDGVSGLTSLVGAGFSFDPVTGEVHGNLGLHTIKAAWGGMGKVALATNAISVIGAMGLSGLGHPGQLRSIGKTYKGMWGGFTGQGLPGGWAVRSGYLFGNVAQAATPGPGKLGIAELAGREGLVGALARAAEAGAKGHWIAGDARLLSRMSGLTARLHDLAPMRTLSAHVNHVRLRFGGEAGHDYARQIEAAQHAAKDLPELNAERERLLARTLDGGRHVVGQASSPREALDKLAAHVDHALPKDRELRDRIAAAENKLGPHDVTVIDHHGTPSRIPIHGPRAGRASDVTFGSDKGVRAFEHAVRHGGPLIKPDTVEKTPGWLGRGLDHVRAGVDRLHGVFNPEGDHVGIREVSDGHGVRQEVFYAHKLGDRDVETVFGVVHGNEVVRLKTPRTYFVDTKELASGIPLPKEVKELYASQWHKSAWEAVPFHNVREDAASNNDDEERVHELRQEHQGWPHEAP